MDRGQQNLRRPLRLDSAVAEKSDIPKRIGARSLLARARIGLEPVDGRRALLQITGGNIDFDGSGAHAQIVRVERRHEQRIQLLIQLDLAAPAIHTRCNLVIRALVVIDRALQQQLRLALRTHLIEGFNLML